MTYEKSCGAVIFCREKELEYLIIFNKKGNSQGHWGFAKGHAEKEETEEETATREIKEETGLSPKLITAFRRVTRYSPKENVTKDVVYFLAESNDKNVTVQQEELGDFRWCKYEDALSLLTYKADKNILSAANDFITR